MPKEDSAPPRWITPLLAVASLLVLAASLLALLTGDNHDHQFHGTIADITVNLGGSPVREHCTTCHTEGGRPTWEGTHWMSSSHPDITPHAPERLGCTGCHLGEGMAMDRTFSHGLPGLGGWQVLQGQQVQGRCYVCHELEVLPGAEKAWNGYRLFRQKACYLCHYLDGMPEGSGFGPDLSHVGSQLGLAQLEKAIRDPRAEPDNSTMPRFPLSRNQVRDLTYFLKSRVEAPLFTSPMWITAGRSAVAVPDVVPEDSSLVAGERLLWQGGCLACHQYKEEDGRIAPDLTRVGKMRDRDYLEGFLEHPSRLIPGAAMPPSLLSAAGKVELVEFLAGATSEEAHHPESKKVYMHHCQRCHAANGDGKGLIQPNLAQFPRAFLGNDEFFRRVTDSRLRDSLARGISGTSMPPYEHVLSAKSREDLLDLIFQSFIGISREDKVEETPLPPRPDALPLQRAERLYDRFCAECHGRSGTGKGPKASRHLPRPRNLTNAPFFTAVEDERILRGILNGVSGTAMPAWRGVVSDEEAWALVEKVRRFSGGRP